MELAEMTRIEVYASRRVGNKIAQNLIKLHNDGGFRYPFATAMMSFKNGFEDAARNACDLAGSNDLCAARQFVAHCRHEAFATREERNAL